MGFGKFIGGAILGVGAIIAAPIVIPAAGAVAAAGAATAATAAATVGTAVTATAATVGTAITGVAATVGTAATGVATAVGSTAVGSAVTGAVTTAASAVASSTVGSAAVGAMAVVGEGVGTAAGAVGLSSVATVAAGGTASAAAVGTIATSGAIGAATAVDGVNKMKQASDIKDSAEDKYNRARTDFDKVEKSTNKRLESLGSNKMDAWGKLGEFVETYQKIHNIEELPEELKLDSELKFDENELANVTVLAVSVRDVVKGGAASLTAGNLIGLATSTGFTSIATASTGTAIAGLHGAAATNASLAALGGGSLSAGGLGMAGGAVVANALTIAPAAAIGGIFLRNKGAKSLDDAYAMRCEVNELVEKMEVAKAELSRLGSLAKQVEFELLRYSNIFSKKLSWLKDKVSEETDFRKYSIDEKKLVFVTGQLATILKDLTCAQLMTEDEEPKVVEGSKLTEVIVDCNDKWNVVKRKVGE